MHQSMKIDTDQSSRSSLIHTLVGGQLYEKVPCKLCILVHIPLSSRFHCYGHFVYLLMVLRVSTYGIIK